MNNKKNLIIIIFVLLIAALVLSYLLLKKPNEVNEGKGVKAEEITFEIKVVGNYNLTIDNRVLKKVKITKDEYTMVTNKGKVTDTYEVVKLTDVFEEYKIKDYNKVIMKSEDQFEAEYDIDTINNTYIGLTRNNDSLKLSGPIKIVVPDGNSKYWINNVVEMEIK